MKRNTTDKPRFQISAYSDLLHGQRAAAVGVQEVHAHQYQHHGDAEGGDQFHALAEIVDKRNEYDDHHGHHDHRDQSSSWCTASSISPYIAMTFLPTMATSAHRHPTIRKSSRVVVVSEHVVCTMLVWIT
jgi:hypothetical protein